MCSFFRSKKITILDFNHVLPNDLNHEEVNDFFNQITPYFQYGERYGEIGNLANGPIGMRVPEASFPRIIQIIREGDFSRRAQNAIRNMLSLTIDMAMVPHGRLYVCEVQV